MKPRMHEMSSPPVFEVLLRLYVLCPRVHEGATPVEHVGALVGALDTPDGVSQRSDRRLGATEEAAPVAGRVLGTGAATSSAFA